MSEPKINEVYTKQQLFKSLLSGLIVGSLISLPFVLLAINLLLLYIYHVTFFSFILLLVMSGWVILIDYFYYKTLKIYHFDTRIDYKQRFIKESIISTAFIIVVGMIVVLFIIPTYI